MHFFIFVAFGLHYFCSVMSYTNLVYHIVFRTYRSESTIAEANERELYQKEHHRSTSFAEEYRRIIVDGGVEIDERFFLMD